MFGRCSNDVISRVGFWGDFWDYFGLFGELAGSPFLCPKWSILGSGVTTGVTNWGYIFRKVGLQKWVKLHTDS